MKKTVLFLATVILLLSISTFGGEVLPKQSEAASPQTVPVALIPNPVKPLEQPLTNPVHEYGVSEALTWQEKEQYCSIAYPLGGIPAADAALKSWAEQTKETYLSAEVASGFLTRGKELTVQYESFLVNARYASVLEEGWYNDATLAHPTGVAATFNIDMVKNKILSNEDIFIAGYEPILVALLRTSIQAWNPAVAETVQPDVSWLKDILLKSDGIEIILPRGEFLASALGTQRFFCAYSQIKGILKLALLPGTMMPTPEIDPSKPMVALTFDDGPSHTTPHILDLLRDNDAHATFFMVGNQLNDYKNTVLRVLAEGNEIGSHSWSHPNLKELEGTDIMAQLQNTSQLIQNIVGSKPHLLRPPYGSQNDLVRQIAKEQNLAVVNWSVDTMDWKHHDPVKTLAAVQKDVRDGSIILCHDLHETTGVAMEHVIPWLKEQGYQMVTVSTLLHYKRGEAQPGGLYFKG